MASPPPVPEGWKAEWSGEYNTWYAIQFSYHLFLKKI
jgi:hypothetical protein